MAASASLSPSASPSVSPSVSPSASPSVSPSRSPSVSPSVSQSVSPSVSPSAEVYSLVSPTVSSQWRGIFLVKWEALQVAGDTGAPFACPNYPIKSIQIVGTFGGATVTMQGSNIIDSPVYASLTYDGSNAIALSSAGMKKIWENTYWVRPILSGGNVTTSLDVYLLVHTER